MTGPPGPPFPLRQGFWGVRMQSVREGSLLAGKYRVERVLGQGGMGVVVAARHEQLDDRVAIKLMLPSIAVQAEAVARFVREARAAAKIKSDHIARVSDVGTLETGEPYMVMEYLEGHDLSKVLAARGRLPLEEAVDYLLQACDAIAEAHAMGIIHRDLKPANLYLTRRRDGSPLIKVLDFGISKMVSGVHAADSSMTRTSALMGSPLYMSPEQMNSARDVDGRSDVWALGVILYELLAGEPPFNGYTLPQVCAAILQGPTPDIRQRVTGLPEAAVASIYRCLERDPARRFSGVAELAQALAPFGSRRSWAQAQYAATYPQPALAATPAPAISGTQAAWGETAPPVPRQRRGPWLLASALALLGLGVVAAAVMVVRSGADPGTGAEAAATSPSAVAAAAAPTASLTPSAPPVPVSPVLPSASAPAASAPALGKPAPPRTAASPTPAPPTRTLVARAKGGPAPPSSTTAPPAAPTVKSAPATGAKPPGTISLGGRL